MQIYNLKLKDVLYFTKMVNENEKLAEYKLRIYIHTSRTGYKWATAETAKGRIWYESKIYTDKRFDQIVSKYLKENSNVKVVFFEDKD